MAKRPQLPDVILDQLPEKHGVFRQILEDLLVETLKERRQLFHKGKLLWMFRANAVSLRVEYLWQWMESGGFQVGGLLELWTKSAIHRAMRAYERLKPLEPDIERIHLSVQYFVADHEFDPNWIPLMKQVIADGQELTIQNFRDTVDPRIGPPPVPPPICMEPDPLPVTSHNSAEGNGHCRKGELLEADDTTQSGGSNGSPESAAHESGFSRSGSRNGKPIERTVIRAQVAHDASEHIHDAIKTIKRACDQYGFQGRGRWEEAWFSRFRGGCEEALQALQEWEKVPLAETR